GCLPNHIVGKGVVNKLRERFPDANITPVDYDPSATKVNQENRIKLMLAVARENLQKREGTESI
ncbi:MAG: 2-hydroxyglutaryl-CoA dehydratase, partial [Solobacterium sp.]|nr:2-hydroxyglutaryl-CoA dehydratase [Solobacterium sp.]